MSNKTQFRRLRKKWFKRHKELRENLWQKHKEALDWVSDKIPAKEQLASGAVGALMLTSALPASSVLANISQSSPSAQVSQKVDRTSEVLSYFRANIPEKAQILSDDQEKNIADNLSAFYGFGVSAQIDGKRLNRSYGLIGAEQHLARYPGDNVDAQLVGRDEMAMYGPSGMAPGLGAWGYFTKSSESLTPLDTEREKWYIAVPTFDAPGYLENVREYHEWFKFRKMLVINSKTGQAVVTDVGDAGPANWTGKHLGGSPEVMQYLGLAGGPRKGAVLYFFINDNDADKVSLGPVKPFGTKLQ